MTPIIALCCGALMILTVLPGVDNIGQNLTTTYDKYSCFDGQAYIFDELQLPYAFAALPRGITEFYVEDRQIEPGIRPRIDAKIQISLSESIASEDLGIVSAHVNGKTFIQLRIEPEVNKPENTLWTTATLTDNTVEGRFNALDIVVDISNYLQHNSLVKGVNTLEEEAVALVTRSVVARESSRVDAAQPLGYLLLGLLAALGAWLLLSSRRHSPDA